jgi:hypothetical protein
MDIRFRPSGEAIRRMALDKYGLLLAPDVLEALKDTERDPEEILRYALDRMGSKPVVLTLQHLQGAL